jgi:ankyrin repeat protein
MKMLQNLELSETLFFHIKDRNYSQFKQLFEKYKMNPDTIDSNGNSFLSLAVQSNSFQIVNYLINSGASVNSQNKSNNTPLHYALSFHNYEIADMLIKSGANEKVQNKVGMTPWECLDASVSII